MLSGRGLLSHRSAPDLDAAVLGDMLFEFESGGLGSHSGCFRRIVCAKRIYFVGVFTRQAFVLERQSVSRRAGTHVMLRGFFIVSGTSGRQGSTGARRRRYASGQF